ncbi:YafY family protein [Microbacterium phosphatis]|uniref:helix-turn-helix transcriptional regulator n=1 Tax=Microbacterium phosphatis TaxID=3140248 RepID=UPI0031407209
MSRPTARVLALLEVLERGGTHTAASLARHLAVDERTVRRYIAHLEDLEVRIERARGRHGGYRLLVGERMPPLVLDDEEALAVALGLVGARRSGLLPDAPAAERATRKVHGALPAPMARRVADVLASTAFTDAERDADATELRTRTLMLVATAARAQQPVWFHYTARDGRESARTLHPYGVVAHAGRWYATGHDVQRDEARSFRLDRMHGVSILPGGFTREQGFDAREVLLRSLAATPWRHEVSVRMAGSPEDVARAFPPGIAIVDPHPDTVAGDEWCIVRLRAERLDWVAALLAGSNRAFTIEAPDELRAELRALAGRLRRAADGA